MNVRYSKSLLVLVSLMFMILFLAGCRSDITGSLDKGIVTGIVKDEFEKPLSNIKVTIEGSGKQTVTNSKGEFNLTDVDLGHQIFAVIGDRGTGKVSLDVTKEMDKINIKYPVITKVVILHFNDAHGTIEPLDRVAWKVDQIKKDYENVFVVNAGDNFSGNPVVDQYDPKGYPIISLMNKIGFDVMVLGNHEFDYGQDVLNERIKQAKFDVICANLDASNAVLNQPEPYVILKTDNNLKIAFLGLVQVDSKTGIPGAHPDKLVGINFSSDIETAFDYSKLAENNLFVVLSHLGIGKDNELASQMKELDLIIGGHSHTIVTNPKENNNVLITQAGDDYNYLGKIVIIFENGEMVRKSAELIEIKNITGLDSEITSMIEKYNKQANFNEVIAVVRSAINGKDELGSMMTDAVTNYHNLDIAFQNNGGIRLDTLSGYITLNDIYELAPFGNTIVRYELTAEEIRSLIKYSYNLDSAIDLQVSGIEYTVNISESGVIDSINLIDYNGSPIPEDKTYQVGLNSYIASSYDFDHNDEGQNLFTTMADTIIEHIRNGGNLDYDGVERTHEKLIAVQ